MNAEFKWPLSLTAYDPTMSQILRRDSGDVLCTVRAVPDTFHPVTVHLGGAVMVLSKRDALAIAHALVNAVLSLPKEI